MRPCTLQDPEGILAQPQGGHIQRRSLQKQLQTDKELAEQVEKERLKARDELMAAREVRRAEQYQGIYLREVCRLCEYGG